MPETHSDYLVSVVIRVRNESIALRKVLNALHFQTLRPHDIVVVDNESTDGSRDIAVEYGARLVDIRRAEFSYGRALNRGIAAAAGEFIVILSAHSLPVGPDFLYRAVEPFCEARVAGVRCLHVGNREEVEGWTESKVLSWPVPLSTVISFGPIACACAIRRAVWESIPFDEEMVAVEDKFWALEALKNGFLVARGTAMYLYMREIGIFESVRKMNQDRLAFFRKTGTEWQRPPVSLASLLSLVFHDVPLRAVRTVAKEILLYLHLRTIPWQAQRKIRTGSVR